jgi:iron complex transport system ATP-binding protein
VLPAPSLCFDSVTLRRDDAIALADFTWQIEPRQRWVVLGPNGSGKTSMLQLATGAVHPTRGTVEILGERLGRTDVRQLRRRIGLVSGSVTRLLRSHLSAHEVVVTGRFAALEPWWHQYADADHAQADDLLDRAGLHDARHRSFGVLSEGERQQVLLARAMMGEPELLLFDEPAAGLDLGARERLLTRLDEIAADASQPAVVFVTHHVEEIPRHFGHVLLLRKGRIVAAGPIGDTLTGEALSEAFDLPVTLHHVEGRYLARARPPRVGRGSSVTAPDPSR